MNKRLASLDILRGLDMFLLAVVGPLFYALDKAFDLPDAFMRQFSHGWGGFTLWDIIMPLFIFMSGAAVPFAMWAGPVVEWLAASLLLVAVLYLRREMRQWKKSR